MAWSGSWGRWGATVLVNRQHRLTRWDEERALVVGELVEIAARSEGSNFRRGRSGNRKEPAELRRERRQRCEDDLDTLLAKAVRLRAVVPRLSPEIDAVLDTDRAVRRRADLGLTGEPDEGWAEIRDAHRSAVTELARPSVGAAPDPVGIGSRWVVSPDRSGGQFRRSAR